MDTRSVKILAIVGARLRALREEKGLTQEALASLCGLDRTYISGIERGKRNVAMRNLHSIARALDVSLSQFFESIR
ncbi:MAG TPA: helix-turn-helix transcriptional regulator [Anaerolineae bacterium]|nr:helix-turn-helix transcriptional regulator [Anaerolineae bacterium]